MTDGGIWCVVPIKRTGQAKQRLSPVLTPATRQELAVAMFRDVLDALVASPGLAGIAVVTEDPLITHYAVQAGCRVLGEAASDGHTAAVTAAARLLALEGWAGMLTVPGDIPLVTPAEIATLLAAHAPAPSVTIAPSHDELGSNAIILSPPDVMTLRFGEDSFRPHCRSARAMGIEPRIVTLPGLACDLDTQEDIARLMQGASTTRATEVLARSAGRLA